MITKDSKCGQLFTGGNNFFKITQYPSRRVEIHFETGKKLLLCTHHFENDNTQTRRHPVFKQISFLMEKRDFQRDEGWVATLDKFLEDKTGSPYEETRTLRTTHPYLACELLYDALSPPDQKEFIDTLLGKLLNSSPPEFHFSKFQKGNHGDMNIDKVEVHFNGWLLVIWDQGFGYHVAWKNNKEYVGECGIFNWSTA